jgi:uncharacterized protein (DUF2267 family)
MAQDSLKVFEHTIEITHTWLNDLQERLAWRDRQRIYRALRAVLHALRDRLSVDDASHLAAQLPMLVRGFYYEGYHPAGKPLAERRKAEFLAHVKGEFADEGFETETVVRAVFNVLAKHITPGEIDKVKQSLPEDIRSLWA